MTDCLNEALYYASRGWHVVPVRPAEKRPVWTDWPNLATTDPELIVQIWQNNPTYGVGIVTGRTSNIWVLDIDPDHGGSDSLADLENEHGELPDTLETITGSGGRHLIFKWPDNNINPGTNAGRLGPGLDIRAEGGFIVAPPTIHPNGRRYAWELSNDPHDGLRPAECPQWIYDRLDTPTGPPATLPNPQPERYGDQQLPTWDQLLTTSGATYAGARTNNKTGNIVQHWTRPDKDPRLGTSATLNYSGLHNLKIFTSNWPPYSDGETVSQFRYYTNLHHEGDERAARQELQTLQQQADLATLNLPEQPTTTTTAETGTEPGHRYRTIPGGTFIHDQPEGTPARWGTDDRVLWAEGEALIIAGGPGVGKSTLTANLINGLINGTDTLELPVKPSQKILYLALDRPRQIARNLKRILHHIPRDTLNQHLTIRAEPLPRDITKNPETLLDIAQETGADILIIDSLKDLITDPSNNEQGGAWNRAMQHCVANGIDVLALHHNRKKNQTDNQPKALSEIYGSAWITAGAGSVILLAGDAGDPIIELVHLKQPAELVGPLKIEHHHNGQMTIETGTVDILKTLASRQAGMTAKDLARLQTGKNDPARKDEARAKRALEALVAKGRARAEEGGRTPEGRQGPTRYYPTSLSDLIPNSPHTLPGTPETAPKRTSDTASTHTNKSPGQTAHTPGTPAHNPAHTFPPPLGGERVLAANDLI